MLLFGRVYKITNIKNAKVYIGRTVRTIEKRFYEHCYYAYKESGKDNFLIYKAIRKYGKENFKVELLCDCFSLKELERKEIFFVKKYKANNRKYGYNSTKGGKGLFKCSKEVRKKISESNKGRIVSIETRKKISESEKGKIVSLETRKRMSRGYKYRVPWNKGQKIRENIFCLVCKKEFNPPKKTSKFCSKSCATKNRYLKENNL